MVHRHVLGPSQHGSRLRDLPHFVSGRPSGPLSKGAHINGQVVVRAPGQEESRTEQIRLNPTVATWFIPGLHDAHGAVGGQPPAGYLLDCPDPSRVRW
jgi:hypothetical protein